MFLIWCTIMLWIIGIVAFGYIACLPYWIHVQATELLFIVEDMAENYPDKEKAQKVIDFFDELSK